MRTKILTKLLAIPAVLAAGLFLATPAKATDLGFNLGMTLLTPIAVVNSQGLTFPATTAGAPATVVVAPADATAAVFTATGEPSTPVTGSVVEASITMTTGTGLTTPEQMTVDTFTTGGDMNAAGAATFDGAGALNNLRIGASANVLAEDLPGVWSGTATFRLIY